MRILHLTIGLPWPNNSGAQIRDYALISRIAKVHQIDLVCFCDTQPTPEAIAHMESICATVHIFVRPPLSLLSTVMQVAQTKRAGRPLATSIYVYNDLLGHLANMLSGKKYDIYQIEHSFLAPYLQAAKIARSQATTILSLHNVGELQYRRLAKLENGLLGKSLSYLKAALMRGWEKDWVTRFDCAIFMSETERHYLDPDRKLKTFIIPNGVDIDRQARTSFKKEPSRYPSCLFVGSFTYPPNQDAALFFCNEVMPILRTKEPRCRFIAAGLNPPEDFSSIIRQTAKPLPDGSEDVSLIASPDSVLPLYQTADIAVVPLRAGGGTRLKILEAIAQAVPVISSRVGAEGLDFEDGKEIVLADTPQEIAAAVERLVLDRDKRAKLIVNAHQRGHAVYCWNKIASTLIKEYEQCSLPAKSQHL